jgi:hypothetical protein
MNSHLDDARWALEREMKRADAGTAEEQVRALRDIIADLIAHLVEKETP